MRILTTLGVVIVATLLTIGAGVLVALELSSAPTVLLAATALASMVFVYGPLVLCSLAASWDVQSSGRRSFRWWFLGVVALDVVGAVLVVITAVDGGAPAWVPIVFVAGAAVLLAVVRPIGEAIRRADRPTSERPWGPQVTRRDVLRAARIIVITGVAAGIVSTALVVTLDLATGGAVGFVDSILFAVQLASPVPAMAAIFVSLRFSNALRDIAGRDLVRMRKFGTVVLRGKDVPLDPQEQWGAAQYSAVAPLSAAFRITYVVLLYIGLGSGFIRGIVSDDGLGRTSSTVALVVFVALLAWFIPTTLVQNRRARNYAAAHAELLGSPFPALPLRVANP